MIAGSAERVSAPTERSKASKGLCTVGKETERKQSSSSERQCRIPIRKHGEPHDWLQDEIGLQGEVCKIDVCKHHFGGACGPRETDWDRGELRRRSGPRLGTEPRGTKIQQTMCGKSVEVVRNGEDSTSVR